MKYELLTTSQEQRKEIFEEFFFQVYFRYFSESGLIFNNMYDPELLGFLGLPPTAGEEDIKRRFRALAKKYHPDVGGDKARMRELLDDGVNGLLFDGDASELTRQISRLLEDPDLQARLGVAGREAAQEFDAATVIANYAQGYHDLVHRLAAE